MLCVLFFRVNHLLSAVAMAPARSAPLDAAVAERLTTTVKDTLHVTASDRTPSRDSSRRADTDTVKPFKFASATPTALATLVLRATLSESVGGAVAAIERLISTLVVSTVLGG